jgi:drug/metabolite transporter (DMT)-like permease
VVILGRDFVAHPTLGLGDMMAILAGFFYAFFFLATSRARDKLNAFVAWWLSSLASALALLAISFALRQPFLGYSMQAYVCILVVAVLTQVGGYLSVNYALGRLPAFTQIIGGASILAGIFIVHWTNQKKLNLFIFSRSFA